MRSCMVSVPIHHRNGPLAGASGTARNARAIVPATVLTAGPGRGRSSPAGPALPPAGRAAGLLALERLRLVGHRAQRIAIGGEHGVVVVVPEIGAGGRVALPGGPVDADGGVRRVVVAVVVVAQRAGRLPILAHRVDLAAGVVLHEPVLHDRTVLR